LKYSPGSVGHHVRELLISHGLSEHQADATLELATNGEKINPNIPGILPLQQHAYPLAVHNAVWNSVRGTALEYIDKNIPLHWARPMFAD